MINKKVALRLWLVVVIMGSSFIIFNNIFKGTPLIDFTYNLENTYRVYKGMIPYKDTFLVLTPGSYYLQAMFFKLFNASNLGLVVLLLIDNALRLVLLYGILTKITKRIFLVGILIAMTSLSDAAMYPFTNYNYFCVTAMMLYIWFEVRIIDKYPNRTSVFVAGILLTLPFMFKQNYGLFFGIGVHLVWLFRGISEKKWKNYIMLLIGTIASALLFLVFLFVNKISLMEFLYPTMLFSAEKKRIGSLLITSFVMMVGGMNVIIAMFTPLMSFLLNLSTIKTKTKEILIIVSMVIAWVIIPNITSYFNLENNLKYLLFFTCLFIWLNEYFLKKKIFAEKSALLIAYLFISLGYWMQLAVGSYYIIAILIVVIADIYECRIYKQVIYTVMVAMVMYSALKCNDINYAWINNEGKTYSVTDTHSRLYGLSVKGKWLPEFEKLISYINNNVGDDSFFEYPCEDPVYWATNKKPQLSYFQLLNETSPYSKDETINNIVENNITYVIVKREFQSDDYFVQEKTIKEDINKFILNGYEVEKELGIYTILKRKN